jgi:hypothetical protein
MTTDELRNRLMDRIDSLLGRPLAVWGEDRKLLSALRGFVAGMSEAELQKVLTYYASHRSEEKGEAEGEP